jgi:hypothetical protein
VQKLGGNDSGESPTRSASEPTLHGLLNIAQLGRLWATSGDLLQDEQNTVKPVAKRRVAFQPLVRVVLIPSRNEYIAAGLLSILWWEDSDYSSFKTSAVKELKALMISRGIYNSKEAIKVLYQPSIDDLNEIINDLPRCPVHEDYFCNTPVTIDEPDSKSVVIDEEHKQTMGLIEARTDLDLTELKRHHGTDLNFVELKVVHPLAYMCH